MRPGLVLGCAITTCYILWVGCTQPTPPVEAPPCEYWEAQTCSFGDCSPHLYPPGCRLYMNPGKDGGIK